MAKPNRLKLAFTDDTKREERRRDQVAGLCLNFTGRWGQNALIDLTHLGDRPKLAYAVVKALSGMCEPDGTIKRLSTLTSYIRIINCYLWPFLTRHEEQWGSFNHSNEINALTLLRLIDWLRLKGIRERTAYSIYLTITRIFSYLKNNYPDLVDRELEIPVYPGMRLDLSIVHRQPYSTREASEIERACRVEIRLMLARLRRGAELLNSGKDPRRGGGWCSAENLLWYIKNILGGAYLSTYELKAAKHWSFMRAFGRDVCGDCEFSKSTIYGYMYPIISDLIPLICLLALKTGLNPQSILDLRRDCLRAVPAAGKIGITYTKYRPKPNVFTKIVDNRAALGPGGVIRTVLEITEPCRQHVPLEFRDYLFIGLLVSPSSSGFRQPRDTKDIENEVSKFSKRNSLQDDAGLPLRLQISRLRPTYLTKRYKAAGHLAAATTEAKHKQGTTTRGYVDNEQTRWIHEQTVIDGLQDFFEAMTGVVLNQSPENPREVAQAADVLGVSPARAEAILRGEQDLFIAACKDFYNRPGGLPDTPCELPWTCFTCKNACWTSRTLPRLLSFFDFIIEQRRLLTAHEWKAKFGVPYAVIVNNILPSFPVETIEAARATASAEGFHIPLHLKTV